VIKKSETGELRLDLYSFDGKNNTTISPGDLTILMDRLRACFRDSSPEMFIILAEMVLSEGFTYSRLKDSIDNAIKTCKYGRFSIADIISYSKDIKVYTYNDIIDMVGKYGQSIWSMYRCVKVIELKGENGKISRTRYFASIDDIHSHKLPIISNKNN
jgi:hypothetical protein